MKRVYTAKQLVDFLSEVQRRGNALEDIVVAVHNKMDDEYYFVPEMDYEEVTIQGGTRFNEIDKQLVFRIGTNR